MAERDFVFALTDGVFAGSFAVRTYALGLEHAESGSLLGQDCAGAAAGGTGFLICTTGNGGGKNSFTFLPNVTTTGNSTWRWATSGVTPMVGFYYHVIGVWNKEEAKAYIYVNGELCNTVDAPGEFRFANEGCNWFCVGGDASANGAEAGWRGDVVIARVYNKPLTEEEVKKLWEPVRILEENAPKPMVANVSYSSGYPVWQHHHP